MPVQDAAAAFKLVDSENPGVIKVVLDMHEGSHSSGTS
jgi:hypothetical protein